MIENPRVFQSPSDVVYAMVIAAGLPWWTIASIWPDNWFAGSRVTPVFCLTCWIVGGGFWIATLANRRRAWSQRSPMMRYSTAELEALDPATKADLAAADEAFHQRWKARRDRRRRWNPMRIISRQRRSSSPVAR